MTKVDAGVKHHEEIIDAIEQRNFDKLKDVLKESVIYPKMMYLSRKMEPIRRPNILSAD